MADLAENIAVVSVVRDFDMYSRCITRNGNLKNCRIVTYDNRTDNLPVTVLYNRFLDSGFQGWIVFCHEDWMALATLPPIIESLDKSRIYGPIGVFIEHRSSSDVMVPYGRVEQCRKNGRKNVTITGKELCGRVDSFDCQCMIVHSSLVTKYSLRFDENLKFDMYVEDFCANAFNRFGVESHTVDIPCRHWSEGHITEAFRKSLSYVQEKYRNSPKRYGTIVGHLNNFGKDTGRPLYKWKRIPWVLLRYNLCK